MKAFLISAKIAPKKANIIAKMVRGMSVEEALVSLERTNKKGARIIEGIIKSAAANAQNNDNQDVSGLVIRSIVVNQAQSYRRGVPMARGRTRPIRKFLSHISVVLGVEGAEMENGKWKIENEKRKIIYPAAHLRGAEVAGKNREIASQKEIKRVKGSSKASSSGMGKGSSGRRKKTVPGPDVSAGSVSK